MRVERGLTVALGYETFVRLDRIGALEPIEDGGGPGHATNVYVEDLGAPMALRSETAILRDLTEAPREVGRAREQYELLNDTVNTIGGV